MDNQDDSPAFQLGDRVVVTVGSLAGHAGHVDSVDAGNKRIIVLLDIFGRGWMTPTLLEWSQVQRLPPG